MGRDDFVEDDEKEDKVGGVKVWVSLELEKVG